jgi:hypothetical protein
MQRPCRAPGCSSPAASSFAAFCSPHRSAFRRHGAPDQRAITKAQLKPYLKLVKARMAKNPDSPAWVTLDERWRALEDIARGIVADYAKGRAGSRYERAAAYEVIKLAEDVKPREVVEVATAMVMMWELEPRQFRSDRAFWIQLARRVRGVTDMNFGERWDNARGRVRRCYRELTPKAALILGHWLAETLGVGGQHLARLHRAELEKKANEGRALHDALSKLA